MAEVTASRNNALPYPVYGLPYVFEFPILDADGDPVTGAAGLDSEISKNGDTFADMTNEATEVATSSGVYYLIATGDELTTDSFAIQVKTSTSGAKTTVLANTTRKLPTLASGTSQGGGATYITLAANTVKYTDQFRGCLCKAVIDGTTEVRILGACNASNQQCTIVGGNWVTDSPDSDDTYTIYQPEGLMLVQAVDTAGAALATSSALSTLSAIFTGITSLAQWLGLMAGKQTGNSTARTELRATGAGSGTFDETTDSLEGRGDTTGANQTTILARLGSWTGTARNTILGAFQALFRSDGGATVPSDINADLGGGAGDADNTTDSLEAIKDAAYAGGAVASVSGSVGSVAGDVAGKVLGGGTSEISDVGAMVNMDADLLDYLLSIYLKLHSNMVSASSVVYASTVTWEGDDDEPWPTGCVLDLYDMSLTRNDVTHKFEPDYDHDAFCRIGSDGSGGAAITEWLRTAEAHHPLAVASNGSTWETYGPMPAGTLTIASAASGGSFNFKIRLEGGTGLGGHFVGQDGGLHTVEDSLIASQGISMLDTVSIAEAVRDVDNSSPAAGSLGEDAKNGGAGMGPGTDLCTITIKDANGSVVPDCQVWISSDLVGAVVITSGFYTNDAGEVTFRLNDGGTYHAWRRKAGKDFANPYTFTAIKD